MLIQKSQQHYIIKIRFIYIKQYTIPNIKLEILTHRRALKNIIRIRVQNDV